MKKTQKDSGRNFYRYKIFKNGRYLKLKWIIAPTYEEADAIIKKECKDILESGGKIFNFSNKREII